MSSQVWMDVRAWDAVIADIRANRSTRETGGPLFGYENDGEVVIACAFGLSPAAQRRRTSFDAPPSEVQSAINRIFKASSGRYRYLGMWHTHPGGPPEPSAQDLATLAANAGQRGLELPSPLALIVATTRRPWGRRVRQQQAWSYDSGLEGVRRVPMEFTQLPERFCG